MNSRLEQARAAVRCAFEVRRALGIEQHYPVCPIDAADRRGVEVWFSEVGSMEGLYIRDMPARMLLPADRPLGRQAFACAHELGHHELGHGTRLSEYLADNRSDASLSREEFAAHVFAGAFLMPRAAVQHAFRCRGWSVTSATPEQMYVVSCALGVSFEGLLTHLSQGLRLLSAEQHRALSRVPLPSLRESLLGAPCASRLVVADVQWQGIALDLAVGDALLLPRDTSVDAGCVQHVRSTCIGEWYEAIAPGIGRATQFPNWAAFVRVRRQVFVGLASVRHLDDPDVD